jgi:hypothetical protein
MDRTREETATRALRMLGIVASDEPPTADQMDGATMVLGSIWAEAMQEARAAWDIATGVPPEGFVPLANWLAAELAAEYAVAPPMSRGSAKLRLLAVIRAGEECGACCMTDDYGMCLPQPTPVTHGVWDDNANWSE